MSSEEGESTEHIDTAQCGACQEEIPADSESCPKCGVSFSGVKEVNMGECGSCKTIVPLDSKSCPNCSIAFVLDDLLQSVNSWMKSEDLSVDDVFGKWDHNDDGVLSGYEIKKGLIEAEIAVLPKNEIERFIHQLDLDNDSMISLTELNIALMLDDDDSSGETDPSADSSDVESDDDDSEDGKEKNVGYSENVLARIMKKHGIEDEEAFLKFAISMDEDENSYLKESELKMAADAWDLEHSTEGGDSSDQDESDSDDEEESSQDDDSEDDSDTQEEETEEVDDEEDEEESSQDDDSEDDSDTQEDETEEVDDEVDEEESDQDDDSEDGESDDEPTLIDQLSKLVRESDENIRSNFNEFDSNKDKRISGEEFRETVKKYFSDSFNEENIDELMQALDEDEDGTIDLIEFVDGIESPDTVNETIEENKKPDGPTEAQIWLMRNEENIFPIGWSLAGLTLGMAIINIYGFFSTLFSCNEGDNAYLLNNEWCANHTKLNILNIFSPSDPASWSEKGTWGIPDILLVLILVALIGGSIWFRSIVKGWKLEHRKKKTTDGSDEEVDDELEEDEDSGDEESDDQDDDSDDDESEDEDDDSDDEEDSETDDDSDDEDDDDAEIEVGSKVGVDHEGDEWHGKIIKFDEDDDEVLVKDDDSGEEYWVPFDALFMD
jgi:Ca2+-binding EF-hand superfamily protein/RNA polymerase subunit RPABC4/transcription elongation factor Spt4